MEGRNSAVLCYGPADQIHRHVMAADLMGEYAEKMQSICMVRISLENLLVKPLRFIQPPGLMMPQGGGEHLLNTRRCLLPQVFSPINRPLGRAADYDGSRPPGAHISKQLWMIERLMRWSAVSCIYP